MQGICSIEYSGFREAAQKLKALPGYIESQLLERAFTAAAKEIEKEAYLRVPKRTGRTADSVRIKVKGSGKNLAVSVICEQEWPFVGLFLEKGTTNHFGSLGQKILASQAKYNRRKRLFTFGSQEQRMAPHDRSGPNEDGWMRAAFLAVGEMAARVACESLKQGVESQLGT
jgi:hypothetical protein